MGDAMLKLCPVCKNNNKQSSITNCESGYDFQYNNICKKCGCDNLIDTGISMIETGTILFATDNFEIVKKMIELKKNDTIEYSINLAQFKEIADNKRKEQEQEHLIPKCPRCGSSSITTGQKGYGLITGFWGSSKTVNRCGSCGHTWQPGR